MQQVTRRNAGWVFVCNSAKHRGNELVSPVYSTKQQAEHMLEEHNNRQHNK